ncbi:MAG: hypothetical protein M1840_000313 [Geoglossum simile]|nr:MAG: hypothetical protein M1840_000313 [Geoglossum simile]
MSEDEDYFDDDYWEYYESPNDGVAARADDLAEHTMHSPVWADIDPDFETEEFWSDWENYSDDYYDCDTRKSANIEGNGITSSPKLGEKRKRATGDVSSQKRRKREKTTPNVPTGESLGATTAGAGPAAPIVIWRSKGRPEKPPALDIEDSEKVAVLKDWRERLQNANHTDREDGEIDVRTKSTMKENRNAVKAACVAELGSSQLKSAELGSCPPAKETPRGAIASGEGNGVLPCVSQLQEKIPDKGITRKSNVTVKARTKTDPKIASATAGSVRSTSGAGQKRMAPEPKEQNGQMSKKTRSNKQKPSSGTASVSSGTTHGESGNHP